MDTVNMIIYILVIFLVLACLIWMYVKFNVESNSYELIRRQNVNDTIEWLYQIINDVCYHCNMSPIYDIVETSQITYTDKITKTHNIKGTIYLVVWDDKYGRVFNHNTLVYAVLHEISHILSPSIHHEPPFDSIESLLMNTAINLGYYDPSIPMESNYMTLDLAT
jgi:hypothetical protein